MKARQRFIMRLNMHDSNNRIRRLFSIQSTNERGCQQMLWGSREQNVISFLLMVCSCDRIETLVSDQNATLCQTPFFILISKREQFLLHYFNRFCLFALSMQSISGLRVFLLSKSFCNGTRHCALKSTRAATLSYLMY